MNKLFLPFLLGSVVLFGNSQYSGSTLAPVNLAGGIIKAKHTDIVKKYKRKDCPVCKGKGWYISGDGIKKVDCGYCEPEDGASLSLSNPKDCNTQVNKQ
jgi:hypothetical protein